MRSGVVVLGCVLVSPACGFHSPGALGGDAGGTDVAPACASFASELDTCRLTFNGDLTLSGHATYSTDTHVLEVDGLQAPVPHMVLPVGPTSVDVIFAHDVRITTLLEATGALPLAIVASGRVTLNASAMLTVGKGGAGTQASCVSGPTAGADSADGAGGGGGGGYGTDGGAGGVGNSNRTAGGIKGTAVTAIPAGLHGGCPGANGGKGDQPGGLGGAGGGAIYVVAADTLSMEAGAVISAGGAGGLGGMQSDHGDGGGGGGGSGGMIIVEAPHIMATAAVLVANGGGGGEGSDDQSAGNAGDDGSFTQAVSTGGHGNSGNGGDGGSGGALDLPIGQSSTDMSPAGGGGGGGGGVGFIRVVSPDSQLGVVSPAKP